MSTQLFEEEAPTVAAPKNGRSARTAPAPKPEIALTDPFADEPEVPVSAAPEAAPVAIIEAEPAPMIEPEPTIEPEPVAVLAPAAAVAAPIVAPTPAPLSAPEPVTPLQSGPRTLPDERQSLTITLKAGGCEGLVIVGLFDDGAPGEVLLLLRKAPVGVTEALEAFAATLTLALPYGIPTGTLATQLLALLGNSSAHEAASAIAASLSARFA